MSSKHYLNKVFYKGAQDMSEIPSKSIDLIVTSPPYFNIKNYAKDGKQINLHSIPQKKDIGQIENFEKYIDSLLVVWKECFRVLKPNGKLCINAPLMPIKKVSKFTSTNRSIYDIQSCIQNKILNYTKFQLMDLYIWNRTNPTKKLMFGSYPYPRNFYAQNTIEFITVYVKPGKTLDKVSQKLKNASKLTIKEWINYTKQIWNIPIANKNDIAFGKHPAIMPIEIANRCIRLFSYINDVILDPFAGSGTTLLVAKKLKRNFVGYEIYKNYKKIIDRKVYGKK